MVLKLPSAALVSCKQLLTSRFSVSHFSSGTMTELGDEVSSVAHWSVEAVHGL